MVDRIEMETGNKETDLTLPSETPKTEDGEKLFAGKYKTPEELEKGYNELVKKLGQGSDISDPTRTPEEEAAAKKAEEEAAAKAVDEAAASQKIDVAKYDQEFATNGTLSPESYKELEDAGLSKEMVNAYIAGQQAIIDRQNEEIFKTVGGEENFDRLIEWAETNLSLEDKNAFNSAMDSGDMAQIKMVLSHVNSQFTGSVGGSNLIEGDTSTTVGDIYESLAQMTADINDLRYKKDEAFRKKVRDKINRSPNLW